MSARPAALAGSLFALFGSFAVAQATLPPVPVPAQNPITPAKAILGKLNLSSAKQLWQVCIAELDG